MAPRRQGGKDKIKPPGTKNLKTKTATKSKAKPGIKKKAKAKAPPATRKSAKKAGGYGRDHHRHDPDDEKPQRERGSKRRTRPRAEEPETNIPTGGDRRGSPDNPGNMPEAGFSAEGEEEPLPRRAAPRTRR